jgi:hypothetical protein
VVVSPNNGKGSGSASSGESDKEDDSSVNDRKIPEHVESKGVFGGAIEQELQRISVGNTSITPQAEISTGSHDSLHSKLTSGDDCQYEDSRSVTSSVKSSSQSESETSKPTSESKAHEDLTIVAFQTNSPLHLRRSSRIVRRKTLTDDEAGTQAQLDNQILSQALQNSPSPARPNPSIKDYPRPETRILPPGYSISRLRGLRHMTEEALRNKDTDIAAAKERAIMREQKVKTKSQRVEESSEDDYYYSEESSSFEDNSDDSALEAPLPSYNTRKAAAAANGDSDAGFAVPGADSSDRGGGNARDKEYEMNLARKELAAVINDLDSSSSVMSRSAPTLPAKQAKDLKPTEAWKVAGDEDWKRRTSFGQLARIFHNNKGNGKGLRMASAKSLSKSK